MSIEIPFIPPSELHERTLSCVSMLAREYVDDLAWIERARAKDGMSHQLDKVTKLKHIIRGLESLVCEIDSMAKSHRYNSERSMKLSESIQTKIYETSKRVYMKTWDEPREGPAPHTRHGMVLKTEKK